MTNQPRGELVPGGLAMVIGLKNTDHYNGIICKTIQVMNPGEKYPLVSGFNIVHSGEGGPGWICFSSSFVDEENPPASGYELFHERNLLPINPSADPLEISQQMEEKV